MISEKEIINEFEEFYKLADNEEKPYPISKYGFEHEDGWNELVYSLCVTLRDMGVSLTITQQKEKYGELRIYYVDLEAEDEKREDMAHGAIFQTTSTSRRTCESCGCPGKMRKSNGWVMTRCDECFDDE